MKKSFLFTISYLYISVSTAFAVDCQISLNYVIGDSTEEVSVVYTAPSNVGFPTIASCLQEKYYLNALTIADEKGGHCKHNIPTRASEEVVVSHPSNSRSRDNATIYQPFFQHCSRGGY